jgi:sucrose-6-phosphate hydrolase SacC (GH32 family)
MQLLLHAALLLLVLAQTGAPLWGHVISPDLVRWSWLPPALLPASHLTASCSL